MRLILLLAMLLLAPLALAESATITDNGTAAATTCNDGTGRWAAYDGGGGYDSGTVTFQYRHQAAGWVNPCPTTADCQISSGNSGVKTFNLGAGAISRRAASGV